MPFSFYLSEKTRLPSRFDFLVVDVYFLFNRFTTYRNIRHVFRFVRFFFSTFCLACLQFLLTNQLFWIATVSPWTRRWDRMRRATASCSRAEWSGVSTRFVKGARFLFFVLRIFRRWKYLYTNANIQNDVFLKQMRGHKGEIRRTRLYIILDENFEILKRWCDFCRRVGGCGGINVLSELGVRSSRTATFGEKNIEN